MYNKVGLQLYSVRDLLSEDSFDATIERLVAMGYTQAQSAGNESLEMARICKKHGMEIVGTHYNGNKIFNEIQETVELHQALGTTNVGFGAMPAEARTDQDEMMRFIEKVNTAAEKYATYGMKLTYHNHSFEFASLDGKKTVMDYMYELFDKDNVSFVLDTCWVANAGAGVCEWIEKLQGRLDILHLKDIKSVLSDGWNVKQQLCEVGNGLIAWDKVLKTAEATGVKYLVVEQDNSWIDNDPFKSLQVSRDYLRRFIK